MLRRVGNDPEALRQLGALYFDQGQMIQAYPLLKQAAEFQPEDSELQLKFGEAALALRQLPQARDLALQVIDKRPGDETALLLLVDTAVSPDEMRETQQLIESLREKDQDRASYHLVLGILDLRQKNDARAESEFKTAIELDPKSSGAHSALGRLYWSRNDLKAAEAAMKVAADLSPLRSPMQLRYLDFKLRQGDLSEAKALLQRINDTFPDYLPARVYLMKLACAARVDEECAARVQSILAQDAINFDAQFQDSVVNLVRGDAAKAVEQLEHLNDSYREKPKLLYQLAVAYVAFAGRASPVAARDAVDKAIGRLNEAIKLDPHYAEAILTYAELQIRSGNAGAAIESLSRLIKEQPQISDAQFLLTAAYRAVHKEDLALEVLRQMNALFPKDPRPALSTGAIFLARGQNTEARKEFERAIEIAPEFLPALEAIVNLDLAENSYTAAMDRVQKLIEKNPTSAQPWSLRGKIYLAKKDVGHAEADLLKAIELDSKLEPAHLWLAELYASTNRRDQAIELLSGFVGKNGSVPALLQLAKLQETVKKFSAARDSYEMALALSADPITALNNLAVLYAEQLGGLNSAYKLAKRARELAPDDSHVADTLGWILFKMGDYSNALPLLKESSAKMPESSVYQFHMGMAHYMLGDDKSARLALQNVADTSADFSTKDEARQRLAVLAIDVEAADPSAREKLTAALQRWPNDPAVLLRRARFQIRDGENDQAVKTLEKIVADSPQFGPALRQLALLYGERSVDDLKAYALVQKARQAYSGDVGIAKALGLLSYRRQLYPQSAELLEEAARSQTDDPELFYYLGATRQKLKQWTECKAAMEHALGLNLSPELSEKAKQALVECSPVALGQSKRRNRR